MMNLKTLLFAYLIVLPISVFGQSKSEVKGYVFEDDNNNGIFDIEEKGIPGVLVSNQREVVRTDKIGMYTLPLDSESIIFVTKPAKYKLPLNENNFPEFYYIHQPQGSPKGLSSQGVIPSGEIPEYVNFPLIKSEIENEFQVLVVGDPQVADSIQSNYYKNDIVQNMLKYKANFYLALGDIGGDNLNVYKYINKATKQLEMPVYNVIGNHDMNYHVKDRKYEAETYKRNFGPDYYSFNYGRVHFVVLNDIEYLGWNDDLNHQGRYAAGLGNKQLQWLKNDLNNVPEDNLIVFSCHIPFSDDAHSKDELRHFFDLLKTRKHLLSLSGHTHTIEIGELDSLRSIEGQTEFAEIVAGAGCGSWYSMPKDERGIPWSTCMDGVPNGFFVFNFLGNQYSYRYYPANYPEDYQMRISRPGDIIYVDSLLNAKIIVNVFIGDKKTKVTCSINDVDIELEQTTMFDPFIDDIISQYSETVKSWSVPEVTEHIWSAPFPKGLLPGVYKLKVNTILGSGEKHTTYKLVEIKQ